MSVKEENALCLLQSRIFPLATPCEKPEKLCFVGSPPNGSPEIRKTTLFGTTFTCFTGWISREPNSQAKDEGTWITEISVGDFQNSLTFARFLNFESFDQLRVLDFHGSLKGGGVVPVAQWTFPSSLTNLTLRGPGIGGDEWFKPGNKLNQLQEMIVEWTSIRDVSPPTVSFPKIRKIVVKTKQTGLRFFLLGENSRNACKHLEIDSTTVDWVVFHWGYIRLKHLSITYRNLAQVNADNVRCDADGQ